MLKFNSANVNILKRLGTALSSLKFNDVSVWPVSRDSVFTFELPAADPTIDLWLTQSAARAVTVTMDDGTVLNSSQLKAEFSYRFSSGGTHTVTVEVEDGETWTPGADFGSTNHKAFTGQIITDSATNTTLKTAVFGRGVDLSSADAFGAFSKCAGLTSVDFSGCDETTITWEVFGDCSSLTTVVWGNIQNIGNWAFHDCGFVELHIPATVETVGQQAFSSLDSLLRIEIAAKYVDPQAVAHCSNLEYIWVRNTCVELRANSTDQHEHTTQWNGCNPDALFCCEAASKPDAWGNLFDAYEHGDDYQRYDVFWGYATAPWDEDAPTTMYLTVSATALTQTFYIRQNRENGVTFDWGDGSESETVATWVFASVSHTFPAAGDYIVKVTARDGATWSPGATLNNVTYGLMQGAGSSASNNVLKAFTFGKGCTLTQTHAFRYCKQLKSIILPSDITTLPDYTFYNCSVLAGLRYPNGLASVGERCFYACYALDISSLAEHLAGNIGPWALRFCRKSKSTLTIKASSIGACAFGDCTQLRRVWLRNSVQTMGVYTGRNTQTQEITSYQGPFFQCKGSLVLYAEAASKPTGWDEHFQCYIGTANNLVVIWNQQVEPSVSLSVTWNALNQTLTYNDAQNEQTGYSYDSANESLEIY